MAVYSPFRAVMDPYYPFASVWVYGSNCIGFNDGIAVGQLLVITIPDDTPANMVISGPTYDGPRAATPTALGGSAVGAMAGLGGGFDQGAYTGACRCWPLHCRLLCLLTAPLIPTPV